MSKTQDELDAVKRVLEVAAYAGGNRFEEEEQRVQRDPRTGRITASPDYGSDSQLGITFSTEDVFNKALSLDAGVPTFVPMDFITIIVPGNKDLTYHGPVTDFHQWRFPYEYQTFKAGEQIKHTGTPLSEWPAMQRGQIKELEHHGIHTVEQVASLSDTVNGVLRSFYTMKARAQAFLDSKKDSNATAELNAQLAERDERLAKLEAQLAAVLAAQAPAEKVKTKA